MPLKSQRFANILGPVALLTLAWQGSVILTWLIIPAFVWMLRSAERNPRRLWLRLYVIFALWNGLTTYWIANAHPLGVIATVGINGALMATALWFGLRAQRMLQRFKFWNTNFVLTNLPIWSSWLAFEQLHEYWGLAFPWLHLGNTFYAMPWAVQWYSILGVNGGTLWVLIMASSLTGVDAPHQFRKPALWFSIPLLISLALWVLRAEVGDAPRITVAVVQPNIETYELKWSMTELEQIHKVERLLKRDVGSLSPELIVLPETFLPKARPELGLGSSRTDEYFLEALHSYSPMVLFGATTYTVQQEKTLVNRPMGNGYYTLYNTAVFSDSTGIETYHKGKLVAGGETMPFFKYLKPLLGDLAVELGGTSGTLGVSEERRVFSFGAVELAPIICWENEFSDYALDYSRQGANLLAVITNDGWWGNTPGHVQHLHFSGLRAIEQQRYVLRSANTGISAVLNNRGQIINSIPWEEEGVIVAEVPLIEAKTFYTQWGNVLGKLAVILFFAIVVMVAVSRFFRLKAG
ncbi:MAG: hypothetical protein RL754_420 [Bacteroidota bacterium]